MLHNNSTNALGAESMVGENETSMAIWEPQKNPIMKCLMVKFFATTHYFLALQVTYIYSQPQSPNRQILAPSLIVMLFSVC